MRVTYRTSTEMRLRQAWAHYENKDMVTIVTYHGRPIAALVSLDKDCVDEIVDYFKERAQARKEADAPWKVDQHLPGFKRPKKEPHYVRYYAG